MDAMEQARMVRDGEVSPSELVDQAIERIERLNPEINAVIHERFDGARADAAGELPDGPFRGVPLLLKDLHAFQTGEPLHEGTAFLKALDWRADHDTVVVERYKAAGFVVVGRTNTPEFGILPTTEPAAHGATRNPWDTTRSPGGSSGGSAAAVAAGMVAAAHASDGGGSIRIPAAHCGLVGLKPSRARVSSGPDFGDVMGGLTTELAVTRSVRDTAAMLDAISGPAVGDPYAVPPPARPFLDEVGADAGTLRIGVLTTPPGGQFEAHPACVAAAREAAELLSSLGHELDDSSPDGLDDPEYIPNFLVRWTSGVQWNLQYWAAKIGREITPEDVEPLTWALAEAGKAHSGADFLRAVEYGQKVSRTAAQWWADGHDLLLTPTTGEPAPLLGEHGPQPGNPVAGIIRATPFAVFTAGFNTTGQPAISLPLGQTEDGLPVGVQLVAAFGREDLLLRVAAQLEAAAPWEQRLPSL
ncbi:MAG: amidase [Solirubrobacteraceae bacterium]